MKGRARADREKSFLEQVRDRASLPDLASARAVTAVVFRTLRDLMRAETAEQIALEIGGNAAPADAPATTQVDLAELWKDTNPLVAFLSQIRPPLEIDSTLFLRRVKLEAGLPTSVAPQAAVSAVFAATKAKLATARHYEIANLLSGDVRDLWLQA